MQSLKLRMRRLFQSSHGIQWLSLVFDSVNTEREFLRSRADDLTKGMSWWTALGVLLCFATYFAGGEVDRSARSTPRSAMVERRRDWVLLGSGLWCGVAFVFFRAARHLPCVGPGKREAAAVLWIATGLILVPLLERFYFAKVSGFDPYELYPDLSFDDATVLLLMDTMVTAGHLLVPIRWRTLSAVEVLGVLIYAACCASGTPGIASKGQYNLLCLAILSLMAAVGKRTLEYHERRAFLQVIEEKSLRVQTEFQLSRLGEGLARVSEGEPPGGPGTDTSQASQKQATNSEVSFTLSESAASSGVAAAQPRQPAACASQEIGVQTSGQQAAGEGRRDCSTETELVWAADAFQCKRCSARPPLHTPPPPPEEVPEHYYCRICRGRRRRRRDARNDGDANAGSSGSSSSSSSAIAGQYPLTPMKTTKEMLFLQMLQLNFAVHPGACCLYHSGVQELYTAIKVMRGAACLRGPWETVDSQCPGCYLLTDIDEDTQLCDYCMERLLGLGSVVNTDADDVSI